MKIKKTVWVTMDDDGKLGSVFVHFSKPSVSKSTLNDAHGIFLCPECETNSVCFEMLGDDVEETCLKPGEMKKCVLSIDDGRE